MGPLRKTTQDLPAREGHRLAPDVITFNAAISSQRVQWRFANHLLDSLRLQRAYPEIISYSAASHCCALASAWQHALQTDSNRVPCNAAINACEILGMQKFRQESWENAYVSGYTLDKQTLAGFDEKDIPFLENLVEKCIEDSVADVKCIHRGSQGRWKFAWRNKMWSVGSHNSEVSESIKDIEFHRSAMRAYFKDSGPKKMDVFITSH
eukprot:s645_g33.t2